MLAPDPKRSLVSSDKQRAAPDAPNISLSRQIQLLAQRADVCEARFGMDAERAAEQLCGTGKDGKVQTLEQLALDAQVGKYEVMLKEDSTGTSLPVRILDVVLLRLYSEKSGGKVLVELDKREDGRQVETSRLPGFRRERNESVHDAIKRIMVDKVKIAHLSKSLNFERTDSFTEEKEGESPHEIQTLVRTEIIEGYLKVTDIAVRAEFALDQEDGKFRLKDKRGRERTYGWLTEQQANEKQVKMHGGIIGLLTAPILTPLSEVIGKTTGTLTQRQTDVSKKVNAMFTREKKFLELEKHLNMFEFWMHVDPSQTLAKLRQEKAKKTYVVEHENHLKDFTRVLAEVSRLEFCINPPGLQDVPACNERLHRLEARHAVAAGAAIQLHHHVAKVADEYHRAMAGLSSQMQQWDLLLN